MSTIAEHLFVSHYQLQNLIPLSYATPSIVAILCVLLFVIIISAQKKTHQVSINDENFSFDTTKTLRGFAVLFLILGHFSNQCADRFEPLYWAAEWAVIIFLFLSAIGLTKKYASTPNRTHFFKNRLKRLLFPVWISLSLFYVLDYLLLDWKFGPRDMIVHFALIISPDPPNGPDWFISYIFYLYILFYIVSLPNIKNLWRSFIIFFLLCGTIVVLLLWCPYYFRFWNEYTVVFPISSFVGYYHKQIVKCVKFLYSGYAWLFFFIVASLLVLYKYGVGAHELTLLVRSRTLGELSKSFPQIYFVIAIVMLSYLLENLNVRSRFVSFLGEYSLEIYLLHFPFMIYYDFLLFRRPLVVWFFLYLAFIVGLSYMLRKCSSYLNAVFFQLAKDRSA